MVRRNNKLTVQISAQQIKNFFEILQYNLNNKVPILDDALLLVLENPENTKQIWDQYIDVVNSLSNLNSEKLNRINNARMILQKNNVHVSASFESAYTIHNLLDDKIIKSLPLIAKESIENSAPYFENGLNILCERLTGGYQMMIDGKTPQDGDYESKKVIWGHTKIQDPLAQIHFIICHYLERYISLVLIDKNIEIGKEKDYFLNAMIDTVIVDHFYENKYSGIFDILKTTRSEGGLEWILDELSAAYNNNF
jgi:hypothetical protein